MALIVFAACAHSGPLEIEPILPNGPWDPPGQLAGGTSTQFTQVAGTEGVAHWTLSPSGEILFVTGIVTDLQNPLRQRGQHLRGFDPTVIGNDENFIARTHP